MASLIFKAIGFHVVNRAGDQIGSHQGHLSRAYGHRLFNKFNRRVLGTMVQPHEFDGQRLEINGHCFHFRSRNHIMF